MPPTGRCERSIGPMLSSPMKPPSNRLLPPASSRLTHQVKLTSSLSKTSAQEVEVAAAVDGEHLERGPRLHRRVHVAEVPLVGGQRPVRVLEPLPAQQDQLVLGERRVHVGEGHAVEGQVPGREPGVLPLVRHRHDVEGIEVAPLGVAPAAPARRRRRLGRVTVEPAGHVVVVQLLAPQHPGEGLPHHHRLVRAGRLRGQLGVELVGLGPALVDDAVEAAAERGRGPRCRPSAAPAGRSRSRSSAVSPGATVSRYQNAHLVPC